MFIRLCIKVLIPPSYCICLQFACVALILLVLHVVSALNGVLALNGVSALHYVVLPFVETFHCLAFPASLIRYDVHASP